MRALVALVLLAGLVWAAWYVAYLAAASTHGGVPPPPLVSG
jgi:hypothetical protein